MSSYGSLPRPGVVVVRMRPPVTPERAQRLYERLNDELARRDAVLIVCRVDGGADLSVVDTLARIVLMATRRQVAVRVEMDNRELGLRDRSAATVVINPGQ